MSAYIVAHGTINGWSIFPSSENRQDILFLEDIRAELNTDIQGNNGFQIRLTPNGVWFSIIRVMIDGERPGHGVGFFAISAFVPSTHYIAGAVIKEVLINAMNHYITNFTDGVMTRSIGVDWSFINAYAAMLNGQLRPRSKQVSINLSQSSNIAYIQNGIGDVADFFDKPFQPDYANYKAVFFNMSILNPARLLSYASLSIDLNDVLLDITYDNHQGYLFPKLPKQCRKSQLSNLVFTIDKPYHDSVQVRLADGVIDETGGTLIVKIPDFEPKLYEVKFICDFPKVVKSITARSSKNSKDTRNVDLSKQPWKIGFRGEEITYNWSLSIDTYDTHEVQSNNSFCPNDCLDKDFLINLVPIRKISVQFVLKNQKDPVKIDQIKNGLTILSSITRKSINYKFEDNVISFTLPVNEDFEVKFTNDYYHGYRLIGDKQEISDDEYVCKIEKQNQTSPKELSHIGRTISFYFDEDISPNSVQILYDNKVVKLDNYNQYVFPKGMHRQSLSVSPLEYEIILNDNDKDGVVVKRKKSEDNNTKKKIIILSLIAGMVVLLGLITAGVYYLMSRKIELSKAREYIQKDELLLKNLMEYNNVFTKNDPISDTISAYISLRKCLDEAKLDLLGEIELTYLSDNDKKLINDLNIYKDKQIFDSIATIEDKSSMPLSELRIKISDYSYSIDHPQVSTCVDTVTSSLSGNKPEKNKRSYAYNYLHSVWQKNKSQWNAKDIKLALGKYNDSDSTINLKNKNKEAYVILQRLKWLSCRESLNNCDWDNLAAYVNYKDDSVKKDYIPEQDILNFVKDLLNPQNIEARKSLQNYIVNTPDFPEKSFEEVKGLWGRYKANTSSNNPNDEGMQEVFS